MSKKKHSYNKKYTKYNNKRQLKVWISEETYNLLVEYAPEIYGQIHGSLSYVVEEAIKHYLLPYKHTQMHTNPKLSVRMVYQRVKDRIKEITHNPIVFEVPEKILDLAISETRGSDPRTISKWKNLFIKQGLVKPVGGMFPNRVFELIG